MVDFTGQVAIVTGAGRGLYSRMVTDTVADREQTPEEIAFLDAIKPELVVFIASHACDFGHRCYSACAGRFARVFVGLGEGWLADAPSAPTADDIAAHVAEISATDPYIVPLSIFDEVADICSRVGII